MDRFYTIVGWITLGFGCFTLSVVMSPRHSGWPTSLLMISTGWSLLHNIRTLRPADSGSPPPAGLRPLCAVLTLHLICLAIWGASLAMRYAQWGYLPTIGVQKVTLCLGMALCLLAAHDLVYGRRYAQIILIFGLFAAVTPSLFLSSQYQLPAQESTTVQLGIVALAILYPLLLVARRWMR